MAETFQIFLMFLKINLLSTSGPASVGLLYKETVNKFLSEAQFVEAVSFSSALPGSDALQLAMFVGHAIKGLPGALMALLGSILPPTLLMLAVVTVLQRLRGEVWVQGFVKGLAPAIAVLMVLVAIDVFRGDDGNLGFSIAIGAASLVALLLNAPSPLVLLGAGLAGILMAS